MTENKIRIWQTNFETTTQGLPKHKLEFSKGSRIYGFFLTGYVEIGRYSKSLAFALCFK